MSIKMLVSIAAGGAIGAVGRYAVMSAVGHLHLLEKPFPLGTLTVNILGSFILGSLVEIMALYWSPSPELRAMVVVGGLGAFTTFSTFSMDIYYLGTRGDLAGAWLYISLSIILGVGAFFGGIYLFRTLFA